MSNPPDLSTRTIAAIATPPGRGGVGIVRVSGPAASNILRALVPDWPDSQPSHALRLCRIQDPEGKMIDESLVVLFRAPHSYTGDDVVELQCHGGPLILRRTLDACLAAGARVANPGEFTERAYLNGRLDLTQAEAVADLINATTEASHRLALDHLEGALGGEIASYLEALFEAMVLVEAAIDFSHEEHVYQIERDEILGRVDRVDRGLRGLRDRFDQGRRQREGVRVVVMGPTNAGKSSLFNAVVGAERAIVTDVAGTTRDWLEEEIVLGGVAVRLVDTAGLRQTDDRVEAIGIERSRELGAKADVVIFVIDRSAPLEPSVRAELEALRGLRVIVCLNKSDLPLALEQPALELVRSFPDVFETAFGGAEGSTGAGFLSGLTEVVEELTTGEGVLLSRARHFEAVVRAIESLQRTRSAIEADAEHELVAMDLREALDALGAIVGQVTTDDILNRIFGEFCVGK